MHKTMITCRTLILSMVKHTFNGTEAEHAF